MTPQLQITCCPSDWDSSILTAAGITLDDGRTLLPRDITASDLPPDLLAVWHGAVDAISTLDPGGWAATLIIARRGSTTTYAPPAEEGMEPEQIVTPHLTLTIHRRWDDGTTAPPIVQTYPDPYMLAFFDHLTSPSFWLPSANTADANPS